MPKISIIIPVYNVEKYLEKCLNSVSNQTLKDIEIICVNNGSTDNSLKILQEYAKNDNRFTIVNQENLGQSAARNVGIKCSKGDFIAFIDSDDWIDLDFYEKLYLGATKNDCDIAFSDFIRKGENSQKIRLNLKENAVYTVMDEKIKSTNSLREGCVWNKIYKKELIFNNNLYFQDSLIYEDGLFTHKALYFSNKIVSVLNTFYYYRKNPKSIVKSKQTQKHTDDEIMCKNNILTFLTSKNIFLKKHKFLATYFKFYFFNILIFSIKHDQFSRIYYLFGILPVFIINTNDFK